MKNKSLLTLVSGVCLIMVLATIFLPACGGEKPPAEFEVISLDVEPSQVVAGETATITAVVENTGDSVGTYSVALTIDGVILETKDVAVMPSSSEVVVFSLLEETPGIYEISIGELSLSLVVTEPVPGIVTDLEGDAEYGFIDIVSVKVTVEGAEVVVQLELSDLPETLTFNQANENNIEYEWAIYFDIDGDPNTGWANKYLFTTSLGADYKLSIYYTATSEAEFVDSILNECQTRLWKLEGDIMESQSWAWATAETDYTTNTLTIRGTVPGLNTDSCWFAEDTYWATWSLDVDRAPDTGCAMLLENLDNEKTEPSPGVVSDLQGDVGFDFIDIVGVKMTIEGAEAVVQIELLELPEMLIFNQAPGNRLEYDWGVYFDVDGDPNTGARFDIYVGADYELSLYHWPCDVTEDEDSILSACQTALRKLEGNSSAIQEGAVVSADTDYATNTLTIRGAVPGLNPNSRWFAVAFYWDTVSERGWQDRAPDTDFAMLSENSEN